MARTGRRGWARRAACLGGAAAAALAVVITGGPAALGRPSQAAGPGQAQQAAAQQAGARQEEHAQASRQLSVSIESVSPQWAMPGRRVTVTGVVRNGTRARVQGLSVQLISSGTPLYNRDDLGLWAAGNYTTVAPVPGALVSVPGSVPPGGAVRWSVALRPSDLGVIQFGVYPLAAQVLDAAGAPAAIDRTFLPFWPGGPGSQRPRRLSVAWLWPLINRPYQAACPALFSNALAGSLAAGGRLGELLAAGERYSALTHLTWAIDPALVQNVQAMGSRYAVSGVTACASARPMRASATASAWLRGLSAATSGQQAFLTPYADVDIAALSHRGLDTDLAHAFDERSIGHAILRLPASGDATAWPDNGFADAGVLGSLAANGIRTVVLDSAVMPPAGPPPSYTPSAQTAVHTVTGSSLTVLLADHTISQILGAGNPAAAEPGEAFGTAQRFLAETAMIVAERPMTARSVVVAPPRRWDPAAGLPGDLLSETARAPWLKPASLAQLASASSPTGRVPHRAPPAHQVTRGELGPAYLGQVQGLDTAIRLQASIRTPPRPHYLDTTVAALESSAWRGRSQAATRQALLGRVLRFVTAQGRKVAIIDRGQITLSGSTGKVPISIANRLPWNVQVRLHVRVPGNKLTVGLPGTVVPIASGKTMTIRLSVHSSRVGDTEVLLGLLTPEGRPLPGTTVRLTVRATRFGTLALVIMCVALGVFVLTSAARAIRRSRADGTAGPGGGRGPRDGHGAGGGRGPGGGQHDKPASDPAGTAAGTGSVVSGDDLAHDHPPEDPDEYADARGRASH